MTAAGFRERPEPREPSELGNLSDFHVPSDPHDPSDRRDQEVPMPAMTIPKVLADLDTDPATGDAAARDVVAYYHQPDKNALLREAILPLAERCAAHGLAAQVERHWLHGPHLRVRIDGPPEQVAAAAEQGVLAVRGWLRSHPSQSDRSTAELLAEAAAAGRAELIAPPYGPVVPDNTARIESVDRSGLRALLGPDGAALRDDLLRLGLPALRAGADFLAAAGDTSAARVQLLVGVLTAHAAAHPGALVGGHYSYVSHLEDFLLHDDPDGRLRQSFERRWTDSRAAVTALVERVAAGRLQPAEQPWAYWSTSAWELTQRRLAAGADLAGRPAAYAERAAATGDQAALHRWTPELRSRFSEFHRMMRRADPRGGMFADPEYLVYRTCTNGLYRLLAGCGVRPVERYLAAYLVVQAVPELTGHRWRERLAEAASLAAASGPAAASSQEKAAS
ncbi:lantibiotic dehydratase C-terminal domain-containing protein [Kitasatospora sp. LaBMicrA B282]|uniref:lantibiotic dehydratase C-terminal domain-containing protein n=1 Tax=Kitasatospora sp. LaBMicrA B282 TaxID=3420949 RepID=UPI003D0A5542